MIHDRATSTARVTSLKDGRTTAGAIAALVAVAVVGSLAVLLLVSPSGADRDAVQPVSNGAGEQPTQAQELAKQAVNLARVAAPSAEGGTSDPAEESSLAEQPLPERPSGATRILGRVVVEDDPGFPLEGGVARLYCTVHETRQVLATQPVEASGRFYFDLGQDPTLSRAAAVREDLQILVDVPGCWQYDEFVDLSDARGGLVRVVAKVDRNDAQVTLRAIAAGGVPVAGAEVDVTVFNLLRDDVETSTGRTDSDGRVSIDVDSGDYVTATVVHANVGFAIRSAEMPPGSLLVDLGDVLVVPRNAISGRVVGYDGYGIPGHWVSADWKLANGAEAELQCRTDSRGGFVFAMLDQADCRICGDYVEGGYETSKRFSPPASGLVLRVARPTVRLTVLGPDGLPIEPQQIHIVPVDEGGESVSGTKGAPWVTPHNLGGGQVSFLLDRPGSYCASATVWSGEERWSALTPFEIGKEHLELSLELESSTGPPMMVDVRDRNGQALVGWKLSAVDPRSGKIVDRANDKLSELRLLDGTWRLQVHPTRLGYFAPFTTELVLDDSEPRPAPLVLTAPSLCGRILVSVRHGKGKSMLRHTLTVKDADGVEVIDVNGWQRGNNASLSKPLEAGAYVVSLKRYAAIGVKAATFEKEVFVSEGKKTELDWPLSSDD